MKPSRAKGRAGRQIAFRLDNGVDLIEGIRDRAEAGGMRAAAIQVLVGGVERAVVEVAQAAPGRPFGVKPKRVSLQGPLVLVSGQGTIGLDEDDHVTADVYAVFADGEGRLTGGRLEPGSAPVTAAVEGVLSMIKEVTFRRVRDEESGGLVFQPVAD